MIARDDPRPSFVERLSERVELGWLGGFAVLVGAILGVAIASPGFDRRSAAFAGASSFLWVAIRWLALRTSAPRLVAENPVALRTAFSLGLLTYAFAATPELRFAAWVAAGAVTGVTLVRLGGARRDVVRAIGMAWGLQALVVTGGWLARNAFVAIVAARG